MSWGWALVGVIVALVVAVLGAGFLRGMVQGAKEGARRDLFTFGGVQQTTDMLAKLSTTAAHSFVPPGADGRSHPFGWLWWRSHVNAEGKAEHDRGWALAYRRARKAAGLPLTWKAAAGELIISPGRTEPALTDRINPEHDQQS